MKIKVLIVDDEFLLCEHIKRTIDWEKLDMEVAGMAYDGEEALSRIKEWKIELVLTDIFMPNMDGIELAAEIHKKYPEVRVVIITGYGEFKYAQNAIRYGVKQYLLKPVEKESYMVALEEIRKDIVCAQDEAEDSEYVRREKVNQKQWKYLREFISGKIDAEQFETCLNEEEKGRLRKDSLVVAFGYKSTEAGWNLLNEEQIFVVKNWMEKAYFLTCREGKGTALFSIQDEERDSCIQRLRLLAEKLEKEKGIRLIAGESQVFSGTDALAEQIVQAERALASRFIVTDVNVIACEQVEEDDSFVLSRYFNAEQMMLELRKNDRDALLDGENGINTIFHRLRKDNVSKENAIFIATMCASAMTELLSEVSFGNLGLSTKELMEELHEKDSIREVQDFVCMLMDKTLSDVFAGEQSKASERVREAKAFIKENLTNPSLSLQMVAEKLYLNKSYLSNLFRKETGQKMGDYILRHRLALAKKEMDKHPAEALGSIAERSGFNSEYYLIRCFKKQYGITPGSYSKLKKRTE